MPVPYCSDFCSFVEYSEVLLFDDSCFVLLAQDCFGYSVHSVFKLILGFFFYYYEECHWNFNTDCLELVDYFG